MSQPARPETVPDHPAIDKSKTRRISKYGSKSRPAYKVVCPQCARGRWVPWSVLRHMAAKPNFTGSCRKCWQGLDKSLNFRTRVNPTGRRITGKGYVALQKNAISDEDLPMWNQMRGTAGYVFEHRWVYAKFLGRALTRYELIDHMDGVKTNNQIDNLRLYVRGKQEPGSAPGYGTYYDEWQRAEARVRELEALLYAPSP